MRLHLKSFTLTCGILWGLAMAAMTVLSGITNHPFTEGEYTGYAGSFLKMMESLYPGYSISLLGALLGIVYGFIYASSASSTLDV